MVDNENIELLAAASCIEPDRLYFVAFKKNFKPRNTQKSYYFCIDDDFVYENFYNDFGPLNICMLYRYCQKLNSKLEAVSYTDKKIIHYTSMNAAKRLNAACLIGSYAVIYLGKTPDQVYYALTAGDIPAYTRYCDASYGQSGFKISLIDVLNSVQKALDAGFFNFNDFNAEEYECFERVENGDFNWIVPQKFIAFCGPHQKSRTLANGYPCHSPETYFKYFRENNVTTVIRLNAKVYHASSFENAGFTHKDLFFIDGSTPSDVILKKFLTICENTKGAIAVHCKAGLGRTGSLIGAYIMKHYNFTALEAIAWLRLCRPGSVIGHQQQWMEDKQDFLWADGERMRKRGSSVIPHHKYGIYSIAIKSTQQNTVPSANENSDLLSSRVRGISHRVDTMHLNDGCEQPIEQITTNGRKAGNSRTQKKYGFFGNIAGGFSGNSGGSGGSGNSDNNDEAEAELQNDTRIRNVIGTRRRKSPHSNFATTVLQNNNAYSAAESSQTPPTVSRCTPPITEANGQRNCYNVEPMFLEKKLKKPTHTFEAAQRPTIASTVRMSQAALDKKNSQTQGDKLNQIKAMRRQHNSRAIQLNSTQEPIEQSIRYTRARSQPFRNSSNITNMLTTTTSPLKLNSEANALDCHDYGATNISAATTAAAAGLTNNNNMHNHNNQQHHNNVINNQHNNNLQNHNVDHNINNANNMQTIAVPMNSGSGVGGGAAAAGNGSSSGSGNVMTTRARSLAIYTKRRRYNQFQENYQ